MLGPLILDLDGVLRQWDPLIVATAERDHKLPAGALANAAFGDPARLYRAVTGVITDAQWRVEIARELTEDFGAVGTAAVTQWSEPAGAVTVEVLEIVRRERRRRTVAIFSNATSRLGRDLKRLRLLGEVDLVFNSSELGVAKPDPEAFSKVLLQLGAAAQECTFVDDTLANVEAAECLEFAVHHYQTAQALAQFLGTDTRT